MMQEQSSISVLAIVADLFLVVPNWGVAADSKPAWQREWEKTLEGAKKEGQVTVYISGYEEVLPDFQKEYPEIKVLSVTGRGSQISQRLIAERRGAKNIAAGGGGGGGNTDTQVQV